MTGICGITILKDLTCDIEYRPLRLTLLSMSSVILVGGFFFFKFIFITRFASAPTTILNIHNFVFGLLYSYLIFI